MAIAGRVDATGARASAGQLSIQVNNDRLTLAVTKTPQIYLYGVIDAGAPQRFDALIKAGKVPAGSDVYLNAASGDLHAGMALGRMLRAGAMATHLGTPRRSMHSSAIKTATCVDACAYAYLGGLYRWAPSGSDRLGLSAAGTASGTQARQLSAELTSYLKDMDIDQAALTSTPAAYGQVAWLSADRMLATGLANNGHLHLMTRSLLLPPAPYLELSGIDRHGEHRITLQCGRGNVTLTAYDMVGATRAMEIVSRGTRSYFEIDRKETLTVPRNGASVADGAVVIRRSYPPNELVTLLSARSVGAWVAGRNNAFRYGFAFDLYPVRRALEDYYYACWRAAPWPVRRHS